MLGGKKVVVVMPAYNAAQTLERTYAELPLDIVDSVLVVDDHSSDRTVELARQLGLTTFLHHQNTSATVATRRPAIAKRFAGAPTSWSCCTPTTNILPGW